MIEKTVTPFEVRAGATALLGFEMNTESWMTSECVQSQSASDAAVRSAVVAGWRIS